MDSVLVVVVVLVALGFDFTNGFHDTANAVATSVSTRALTPRMAVLVASLANLAGAFVTTAVAKTVGKDVVDSGLINTRTVLAALLGAIVWNLLTWWFGLPTSSSHALIGGFAGAGVAKAGFAVLAADSIRKTILFIVLSPLFGLLLAFLLMVAATWLFHRSAPRRVDGIFRRLQLVSAAAFSLGHGGNDAQKTMGIIAALLVGAGYLHTKPGGDLPVPLWIVLAAHAAIAGGTLVGGWRIVKTLGTRITALKPIGGFSAETAAATSIYLATFLGVPVSTTHTITGAVVGAGSTRRLSAVRWGVARRIVWAWILTIPAAGLTAAVAYRLVTAPAPVVATVVVAALITAGALAERRRSRRPHVQAGT